jgi:pimeloyl-ACP methyl ester carboxylesterase
VASHSGSIEIANWGDESFARWSHSPKGTVLVFVHGYSGSPTGTWPDFPDLVTSEARCSGSDCIFYGYRSVRQRADPNADELLTFLDALGTAPAVSVINPNVPRSMRRPPSFRFSRAVLIAHSLGAVVVRLAMLKALRLKPERHWLQAVELLLFAPAHLGADANQLFSEAFFGPILLPLGRVISPVLRELVPGSPLLNDLSQGTAEAIGQFGERSFLKAAQVVQSRGDAVVATARFCADPDPDYVEEHRTHTTVCKPTSDATLPFDVILRSL